MRTRVAISLITLLFALAAWREGNMAAVYVAIGTGLIAYLLHAIEVKINRMLDDRGISVTDADIARE